MIFVAYLQGKRRGVKMEGSRDVEKITERTALIFLLYILGLPFFLAATIALKIPALHLIPVFLLLGACILVECMRLLRFAKKRHLNLFGDPRSRRMEEVYVGFGFGILYAAGYTFFLLALFMALTELKVDEKIITELIVVAPLVYFLPPVAYDMYKRRRQLNPVKVGFRRDVLPLALEIFLLGCLMFFVASLIQNLAYILIPMGTLFTLMAVLLLFVRRQGE